MSSNPEVDEIVALRPEPVVLQALPETAPAHETEVVGALAPVESPTFPVAPRAPRSRPRWLPSVAVGAVAVIAASTLGYLLFATANHRDTLGHQLVSTQTTLVSTKHELSTAQSDAAARKAVADYVSFYVVNQGRIQTDYQAFNNCDNFSQCRSVTQQLLTDMQAFQSDRASVTVPRALANSDSMLGDALSAAIAATHELVSSLDNGDRAKFKAAYKNLDASMLSMAKAESTLGAAVR
jgi:flagellin-like hook-associated protein FlgL